MCERCNIAEGAPTFGGRISTMVLSYLLLGRYYTLACGGTLWGPDVAVLLGNDGSLVETLRSEREGAEKHRVGSLRVVVVGSAGCCAGRMLWRGGGNGTRMRVCVARVVVLL